jgi:hypothetical protein
MQSVHEDLMDVQSHPYRPELSLLRVFLGGAGYHAHAVGEIVRHAAAEGTLEDAPGLDPVDYEGAELAYVEGMEPVPSVSHDWDDESIYLDVETLLEGGRPDRTVPADAELFPPDLTEEEAAELECWADVALETERARPSYSDQLWHRMMQEASLPPVSGGGPDGMDFPRLKTAAERAQDMADLIEFYRQNPQT